MDHSHSTSLFNRAQASVAGGISSQIRAHETATVPLFFERASGGRMWDVDGNEYVDFIMGMGPNLFGHAPAFIADQVNADMRNGVVFAGQFERELEVAELALSMLPMTDATVRFASSGTEIDQLAIRLMRGHTRRPKFVKFEGHYHGWADSVNYSVHPSLNAAGAGDAPTAVAESAGMDAGTEAGVVVCQWNDLACLEQAFAANPGEIAGVLMEPIAGNANAILPADGYLEGVQALCQREGALLCFDEVITGYRVSAGGAAQHLGVVPDLATYGKAMAGGLPLSMIAGRRDLMASVGDGTVYHGGTFNSNVVAIAAAYAALGHLRDAGPAFYDDLNGRGQGLMAGLREVAFDCGHEDLHVQGPGSFFCISFTREDNIANWREHARHCDEEKYTAFASAMLSEGVRLACNGRMHMASTHTDADLDKTLDSARRVLKQLER